MPEEKKDDSQLEAEMLRLMAQESGGDAPLTPSNDVEAAMLQMLQQEQGAGGGDAAQEDVDSILAREMRNALQDSSPPAAAAPPPPISASSASVFTAGLSIPTENVSRLLDVRMTVSIELGRVDTPIRDIITWTEGSLIELDKMSGEPVDILVNDKPFALGEVVTIAENFGVRITQMLGAERQTA